MKINGKEVKDFPKEEKALVLLAYRAQIEDENKPKKGEKDERDNQYFSKPD